MGTSSSPAELVGKFNRLNNELRALPEDAVGAAALRVKKSVLAVAPARLKNVGKKGSKLNVSYKTSSTIAEGAAYALVRAVGPWQIIERDTHRHEIRPTKRRSRGGYRPAIIVPGYGFFARASHPGTKGKHPWAKGVAIARPLTTKAFRLDFEGRMRKVF